MTDISLTTCAQADLFATRNGACLFAPIRHHSPACAWMLRAMIVDHRPDLILIEARADLTHHLPHIADPEAIPPIAIVALGPQGETGPPPVTYVPFSDTAPDYIAITEAARIGAEVRFIDLPATRRGTDRPTPQTEDPFDSAAFIAASCARLGLRVGAELWDHLFETRLGETDWRRFFADDPRHLRRLAGRRDGMSTLAVLLAALDDGALAAATSKGVLIRARKDAAGVRIDGETVTLDGETVTVSPKSLSDARCTCPATGVCRHIVAAVIALRDAVPRVAPSAKPAAAPPQPQAEVAALPFEALQKAAGTDWPRAAPILAR